MTDLDERRLSACGQTGNGPAGRACGGYRALRTDGKDGQVDVLYGAAEDNDVVLSTAYEPMMAVADGRLTLEQFAADYVELTTEDPANAEQLMHLLAGAMTLIAYDREWVENSALTDRSVTRRSR